MKRRDWIIIIFPLFAVWFVDHITKLWGENLQEVQNFGPIVFQLFHNHGAFLGFFSDLPALLRIVSLSTIGSFLVFSYAVVQYMIPIKSLKLRIGLSILLGGIIGNVYDRIVWGHVVDFIIFDFGQFKSNPMNLADIFQWVGFGFIAAAVINEPQLLWPEKSDRKRLWINPSYQFRYILFLLIITLSLTLIGIVFSYTYLKVTIFELIGENRFIPARFLVPFLFTYLAISFTFCCFLIVFGRKISHRNVGPIFAFERFVNDLLDGRNRKFKLRAGDEFRQLERIGLKLAEYLDEHQMIDREDVTKTLTTQSENADDFTIAAVPLDEQIPDYSDKASNLMSQIVNGEVAALKKCPICEADESQFIESKFEKYLKTCSVCSFVFDPMRSTNLKSLYESNYFDNESGSTGFNSYDSDHGINLINFDKRVKRALRFNGEIKSCLDIGCAYGDALESAAANGIMELHGVEISPQACEKAKEKGFKIFKGTLDESFDQLSRYDLIMLNDVIEHVDDPNSFLEKCHRLLNADGVIIVHTPNISSFSAKLLKSKWFHFKQHEHISFFSPITIRKLAEKLNLEIVSVDASYSYLSLSAIGRRLKIYGARWVGLLFSLIPKFIGEKIIIPVNTGNMILVLKEKKIEEKAA